LRYCLNIVNVKIGTTDRRYVFIQVVKRVLEDSRTSFRTTGSAFKRPFVLFKHLAWVT